MPQTLLVLKISSLGGYHMIDLPQGQRGDDHKPGATERLRRSLVLGVRGVERRDQPRGVRDKNHAAAWSAEDPALLQYASTISHLAGLAADPDTTISELRGWGASSAVHASLALVTLLIPLVLSVFKPRGMTPYGARKTDRGLSGVAVQGTAYPPTR
jgi:hypothetical protein